MTVRETAAWLRRGAEQLTDQQLDIVRADELDLLIGFGGHCEKKFEREDGRKCW